MSGNERLNRKVFRWCWNDCRVDGCCCCCTEYTSGFSFSPIGALFVTHIESSPYRYVKLVNVSVTDCGPENLRKFLMWAEPEPQRWFFRCPAHKLQEKFFYRQIALMESIHSEGVFGTTTRQISRTRYGKSKPQTHEKIRVPEMYLIIHPIWRRKIGWIQL